MSKEANSSPRRYSVWYGSDIGGPACFSEIYRKRSMESALNYVASKGESDTVKVQMSVDDWKKWCKFKECLENRQPNETSKVSTSAISANFRGNTSLTMSCKTDDKSWLIDSGASRHMVGSHQNLVDYVPDVKRQSVKLADGSSQTVMGSGRVMCGPNMSLSSVLHVPSFPINLLSISCITKELNCAVIFFPSWCLFQELGTGRWLGTGNMRDGLYYLDDNVSAMVAAAISQSPLQEFLLHHRRLGHMSFNTLDLNNETGGDKCQEDNEAASRNMIIGVIPAEDMYNVEDEVTSGAEQNHTQGEQQEYQTEKSRWPQDLQVYSRRHRAEDDQVQREEDITVNQVPETQVQSDLHDSSSSPSTNDGSKEEPKMERRYARGNGST